jgi:hypothetical protein
VSQSTVDPTRLVGHAEVVELLGIHETTLWRYRHRHRSHRNPFPEPDWTLHAGPIWRLSTIMGWLDVERSQLNPGSGGAA